MDSPHENMQSLPEDAEALRALILATFAERDAAVSERDTLLAQNDRLRHLLLKLTRCISAPARSVCRTSSWNGAWKRSSRRSPKRESMRVSGVSCCLGLSGLGRIVVGEAGIPFLEERPERAIERPD